MEVFVFGVSMVRPLEGYIGCGPRKNETLGGLL